MLIQSVTYSPLQASYGVKLSFSSVNPFEKKIADIVAASRSNRVSTLDLSVILETLNVTDSFTVKTPTDIVDENVTIDPSFLGTYKPSSIEYGDGVGTLTYYQNILDINTVAALGDLYSTPNIRSRDFYLVQFTVESVVPSLAEVNLTPSSYIVGGAESFEPVTILQLKSLYSKSAKALIKMLIRDINNNEILKTEYIEIIVSDASNAPCEIISVDPIEKSSIYLDDKNDWKYDYNGYRLAEFFPDPSIPSNVVVKLNRKNTQLLPSRGETNRFRIIIDPIKTTNYKITIDQIRAAILQQYNTITSSFALANLGNKSYDIVINDVLLQPEDLDNLVVATVPPETGVEIKFSDIAKSEPYSPDIASIPEVNLLRWNNNGTINYIGEIHFDSTIYLDDPVIVEYNNISLSGNLRPIINGSNYLISIS
jgi:hypothetical protein